TGFMPRAGGRSMAAGQRVVHGRRAAWRCAAIGLSITVPSPAPPSALLYRRALSIAATHGWPLGSSRQSSRLDCPSETQDRREPFAPAARGHYRDRQAAGWKRRAELSLRPLPFPRQSALVPAQGVALPQTSSSRRWLLH